MPFTQANKLFPLRKTKDKCLAIRHQKKAYSRYFRWLPLRQMDGTLLNTLAGLVKRKNGCANVGTNGLLKFAKGPMEGEGVQDARGKSLR
jgi:hypothetical protein